jgi:ankyrin repeat protein
MHFTGKTKHIIYTFCFLLQVCRYLIEAAESGDVNTVKRLVNCSCDSCTADRRGLNTPLMLAAANGHVEVVRVLLDGGADVRRVNYINWNALHKAAAFEHLEVCRLLLDRGVKVNAEGWRKYTALHIAAYEGYLSVVQLLVERGADVRLKDEGGKTAADWARGKGVIDLLDSVSRV